MRIKLLKGKIATSTQFRYSKLTKKLKNNKEHNISTQRKKKKTLYKKIRINNDSKACYAMGLFNQNIIVNTFNINNRKNVLE